MSERPIRLCNQPYPCPCCGYMSFAEPLGSYDICPICFWEDDDVQLQFPFTGGANIPLVAAQANFARLGVKEERVKAHVRPPMPGDVRDPEWRPLNLLHDAAPTDVLRGIAYFEASGECGGDESLYYWRHQRTEEASGEAKL